MHFTFFSIFLLFGFSIIGDSAPSNLELIANEFRILSRVTNAIALQSSFSANKINTRDFLSEVLKLNPKRLQPILNVDVKTVRSEMNRMYQEVRKKAPTNRNELTRTTGSLKSFLEALNNSDYFSEIIKTPSDVLESAIKSVKKSELFKQNCSKVNTKEVREFLELFDPGKTPPNQTAMADRIQKAQSTHATSLRSCLENLPKLNEMLAELNFWKDKEKYDLLYKVKHYAYKFASLSQALLKTVDEKFDKIPSQLDSMKSVWEGNQKNRSNSTHGRQKITKLIGNFITSVWEMRHHRSGDSDSQTTYTAGFRDAKDLKNIFDDLKSPWFLKKVARGASTNNLTKILTPFRGISDEIVALETAFNEIVDNRKLFNSDVREGIYKLLSIAKMAQNSEKIKKLISDSKKIFTQCLPNRKFNFSQFEVFDKEQTPTWEFIREMDTASTLGGELIRKLAKESEYVQARQFLQSISKIEQKDWQKDNVYHTKMRLADLLEKYKTQDGNVLETLTDTVTLVESWNELKKKANGFKGQNKTSKTVQKIVENLKLFKTMDCLKSKKYQAQELHDAFEQLKNVTEFVNHTAIGNMNEYLMRLEKVQRNLSKIETHVAAIQSKRKPRDLKITIPPLPGAMAILGTIGKSTHLLEKFVTIRQNQGKLLSVKPFPVVVKDKLQDHGLDEWKNPKPYFKRLLGELNQLEVIANHSRNGTLLEMVKIFGEAGKISKISANRKTLWKFYDSLNPKFNSKEKNASQFFYNVLSLDLDFARYEAHLKSAPLAVQNLKNYFDEIFGHSKTNQLVVEKYIEPPLSWIAILGICLGLIVSILVISAAVYGCTESGSLRYTNLYLFYFGSRRQFEKRWRYSKFMDSVNGKNWVLDAVREGNKTSLLKALKNGAYVNVYNAFGNTALHAATKLGHPELVALLIKHGADRTLLNAKNLTPEQMIPPNYRETHQEKAEQFAKIQTVYRRLKNNKFRKTVPQVFPWTSFHIYVEDRTDDNVTEKFMKEFLAITSDEPMPTTTHCIMKTDKDGILETEKLELLTWIFNGVIIMQERWMSACLKDDTLIEQDYKYLVEKVRYKGVVYDTVLKWSEAMSKGSMPFLMGAYVAVVMRNCENLLPISSLVYAHGGTMMIEFPVKENFVKNTHPYLHANLGPIFLIHDGTVDLEVYRNDEDKMYTLFTEEEFIGFMLKREIHRDETQNPQSAWMDVK